MVMETEGWYQCHYHYHYQLFPFYLYLLLSYRCLSFQHYMGPLSFQRYMGPSLFSHVRIPQVLAAALHFPCVSVTACPPKRTTIAPYKYPEQTQIVNYAKSKSESPTSSEQVIMENKGDLSVLDAEKLRSEFLRVLRVRTTAEVPLTVEPATPVKNPLYQQNSAPTVSEAMESCPKVEIENFKSVLKEENLYLTTEAGEQGRLPVLILSVKGCEEKRPAIVFLHSTHKNKEYLRPLLEAYASRGYVAIAIDSRHHGERATNMTTYQDALVSAWKTGDTMPFIFDTVWDLLKLADYLTQREDIDPTRIGITGESLGGMHAWFGSAVDTRYSVVVPIIGVQGFRWAIDNDQWQGRVDSIKRVFEEAQRDLGKSAIDKEVAEKVWHRIAPGLASSFDAPYSIPAIAPRPLLIVNGAEDPRCPLAGLELPKSRAIKAYEEAQSPEKFKLVAEPGIGHQMTLFMVKEASDWFDKFLKQGVA